MFALKTCYKNSVLERTSLFNHPPPPTPVSSLSSGHSQATVDGHAQFMKGIQGVSGYNGKYGFRRNTPWLRKAPTPFVPSAIFPTHWSIHGYTVSWKALLDLSTFFASFPMFLRIDFVLYKFVLMRGDYLSRWANPIFGFAYLLVRRIREYFPSWNNWLRKCSFKLLHLFLFMD